MPPHLSAEPQVPPPPFQEGAGQVLAPLQRRLREFVQAAAPGVRNPSDLKKALGLDYNLSWRIMRSVEAPTPLEAGPFVPTPGLTKKLVSAAKRRGADARDDALAQGLIESSDAFDRWVQENAGDRPSFDAILAALTGVDAERHEAELKRTAFRTNALIYGRSVEAGLRCSIYRPGEKALCIDSASIFAMVGLRRLRPQSSIVLGAARATDDPTEVDTSGTRVILDEEAYAETGVPLLSRFSQGNPPAMREFRDTDGCIAMTLAAPDVGVRAEVSCVFGEARRELEPRSNPFQDDLIWHASPSRKTIHDVLMHESLYSGHLPELAVIAHDYDGVWPAPNDPGRLPIQEKVVGLGHAPHAIHVAEVPAYLEIIEFIFERLGWDDLERFRLFRCQVEHPVLHSLLWMRFDLSEWMARGATE